MARMHMLAATLLFAAGATCTEVDIWLTKVIPDADLDAALMRVSTPTHADYGKYLSASDLAALVGHSPATIAATGCNAGPHPLPCGKSSHIDIVDRACPLVCDGVTYRW